MSQSNIRQKTSTKDIDQSKGIKKQPTINLDKSPPKPRHSKLPTKLQEQLSYHTDMSPNPIKKPARTRNLTVQ